MPGGISNPVAGYAVFLAIKFVGYSLAAREISKAYQRTDLSSPLIGGARVLIGVVAGAAMVGIFAGFEKLFPNAGIGDAGGAAFLIALVPIRIFEWWLLVWLFYDHDRPLARKALGWKVVGLGTVWSFVLDIPTIAGLFVVGGFWIC